MWSSLLGERGHEHEDRTRLGERIAAIPSGWSSTDGYLDSSRTGNAALGSKLTTASRGIVVSGVVTVNAWRSPEQGRRR